MILSVGHGHDGVQIAAPFAVPGHGRGIAVVESFGRPMFSTHIDHAHKADLLEAQVFEVEGIASRFVGIAGIDAVALFGQYWGDSGATLQRNWVAGEGDKSAAILAHLDSRGFGKARERIFKDDKVWTWPIDDARVDKAQCELSATA